MITIKNKLSHKKFFFCKQLSFACFFLEVYFFVIIFLNMRLENFNCKKCGVTIASTCSKCDRTVDVKVLDDGCIVQLTKCGDCANVPVIKDVCSQQK